MSNENSNKEEKQSDGDMSEEVTGFSFSPLAAKASLQQPPSCILPFLYLGTQYNATDKHIRENNIQRILCVKDSHFGNDPKGVKFLHVPMSDYGTSSLKELIKECFDFIEASRICKENILVHCRGGINRSATIVIAYLMLKENMTLSDAWSFVKERRSKISPHRDYFEQLKSFELEKFGKATLTEEELGLSLQDRIDIYRKDHISRKTNSHPLILEGSQVESPLPPKLDHERKSKTSPLDVLHGKKFKLKQKSDEKRK